MSRVFRVKTGWAVDYRDRLGRRVRRRVASDRKTCELILADLVRNSELARAGLPAGPARFESVWRLWEDFKRYLESSGRGSRTVENYVRSVPKILRFIGAEFLGEVTLERIDGFKRERKLAGAMAGTVNLELQCLRRFMVWCVRRGLLPESPLRFLESVRGRGRDRGVLEDEEIPRLLEASGWMRPLWSAYLLTGLRRRELTGLRWRDVDLRRGVLKLFGKGGDVEHVPVCDELREVLLEVRPERWRPDGFVFLNGAGRRWGTTILLRFRECCQRAGIDARGRGLDIHGLRRTFGTILASDPENDVKTVQSLMRHKSIAMTMILYARPRALRLTSALGRLGEIVAGERKQPPEVPAIGAVLRG